MSKDSEVPEGEGLLVGGLLSPGATRSVVLTQDAYTSDNPLFGDGLDTPQPSNCGDRRSGTGRRLTHNVMRVATVAGIVVFVAVILCVAMLSLAWLGSRKGTSPAVAPQRTVSAAGISREYESNLAEQGFCNASVRVMQGVTPRTFQMSSIYEKRCNPANITWPRWRDRNLCWGWIKMRCHYQSGRESWTTGRIAINAAWPNVSKFLPPADEVQFEGLKNPYVCDRSVESDAVLNLSPNVRNEAVQWVKDNVALFVMNLERDQNRLAAFNQSMSTAGLQFERLPGVDLTAPGALQQALADKLIPQSFDFKAAETNAKSPHQAMDGITGPVGIAAGHLRAMRTIAEKKPKPLAIVFEDDSLVHQDFAVKLHRLMHSEAPCDWEVIALKSRCPFGTCVTPHLSRVEPDGNEPADRCRHGVNEGFGGVVYRVSELGDVIEKISKAVWNPNSPHCLDIDVAMASISDQVAYYAVPASQMPGFWVDGKFNSSRRTSNQKNLTL